MAGGGWVVEAGRLPFLLELRMLIISIRILVFNEEQTLYCTEMGGVWGWCIFERTPDKKEKGFQALYIHGVLNGC